MDIALYYLLSTVAQTFGTAIALLGALVLYRLQSAHTEVDRASKYLIDEFHKDGDEHTALLTLYWAGNYSAIRDHYVTGPGNRGPGTSGKYFGARASLKSISELQVTIKHYFKNALALTLLLLLVSVSSIPLVPLVGRSLILSIVVVLIVLFGVLTCLIKYTRLVRAVLP